MVRSDHQTGSNLPLRAFACGALTLATAFPAAWAAAPENAAGAIARAVSIADLDLATSAGQRALRHRIALAARQVCAEATGNAQIDSNSFVNCYVGVMHDGWQEAEVRIAAAAEHRQFAAAAK